MFSFRNYGALSGTHWGPHMRIDGSHVSEYSNGVHLTLYHNSQLRIVLKDDQVSVREAIPSSTPYPHISKINAFGVVPLEKREVSSSATLKIVPKESFLHGNGSMHVYKSKLHGATELYKFWDRILAKQLGSNTYEIACGDKGPFQVMSSDGIGCLMYTYVVESLDVKPPLTPFEMVVLDCLNLCPTQLTGNAWAVWNHFSCDSGFPLTWSKVLDLPVIERESLLPSEIKVANWMSEKSERVKDLKAWEFGLQRPIVAPLVAEGGSSKPAASTSISNLTGPLLMCQRLRTFPLPFRKVLKKLMLLRAEQQREGEEGKEGTKEGEERAKGELKGQEGYHLSLAEIRIASASRVAFCRVMFIQRGTTILVFVGFIARSLRLWWGGGGNHRRIWGVIRVGFVVVKWYLCAERMGLGVRRSLVTWRLGVCSLIVCSCTLISLPHHVQGLVVAGVADLEIDSIVSNRRYYSYDCFLDLLGKFLDFLIAVGHPPCV
ncbi:uncharacterized protein G2W53_032926 [Senna tora]|uniref:Uncharacterized protein n=1 Tax=Senna tora TaxID=362788 RepID=A0A834SZU0_9FABA|nr:uncharacterized protein G2W53_032926 [Senna tora]